MFILLIHNFAVYVLLFLIIFVIFSDILGGSGRRDRREGERDATSAGILFDGVGECRHGFVSKKTQCRAIDTLPSLVTFVHSARIWKSSVNGYLLKRSRIPVTRYAFLFFHAVLTL